MTAQDPDVQVVPPEGLECSERKKKTWKLKAWLNGPRSSPRGWWETIHECLVSEGFVSRAADACVYNCEGETLLLLYVADILFPGMDTTPKPLLLN